MRTRSFLLLVWSMAAATVAGQGSAPVPVSEAAAAGPEEQLDLSADRLEYLADRKMLIGEGNVTIRQGPLTLRADRILVHTRTHEVTASGRVVFEDGERVWRGEELSYNFRTRTGDFGAFYLYSEPFYVRAEESVQTDRDTIRLKDTTITSCPGEDPAFYVRASDAVVREQRHIRARNVLFHLGPVPFFWLPFASFDARSDSNFDIVPGHRSIWGAFLLVGYNRDINEWLRSATHVDTRARRGLAVGQDLRWNVPGELEGIVRVYYADDQDPMRGSTDAKQEAGGVEPERYRLRLRHTQQFDQGTSLHADIGYLSDPFMLKDFFRGEARRQAEPPTSVSLAHRQPAYNIGFHLDMRLNDFYEKVERLPEFSVDVFSRRIGDTRLYYQTYNTAAWLRKLYPAGSEEEDYDAFRVDSAHRVSFPTRHFGFLNLVPRTGYRATFYSRVPEYHTVMHETETVETNVVDSVTNIVTTTQLQTNTFIRAGNPGVRSLYEIGMGSSFKAFRELQPPVAGEGGWRHIAEPYTDYTFVAEPSFRPDELYQFDAVDRLDQQHFVRLGMRNKLQTKRGNRIRDWANVNCYADYRLDPDPDQEDFTPLHFDADFLPRDRLALKLRGQYDFYEGSLPVYETRLHYTTAHDSRLYAEYRYDEARRDLIAVQADIRLSMLWGVGAGWRYDFDGSLMEEQSYYVSRGDDCLHWALGFTEWQDDWEVWFQIWLTAFPKSVLGVEGRY